MGGGRGLKFIKLPSDWDESFKASGTDRHLSIWARVPTSKYPAQTTGQALEKTLDFRLCPDLAHPMIVSPHVQNIPQSRRASGDFLSSLDSGGCALQGASVVPWDRYLFPISALTEKAFAPSVFYFNLLCNSRALWVPIRSACWKEVWKRWSYSTPGLCEPQHGVQRAHPGHLSV